MLKMWFDRKIEVIPAVDVLGDQAVRLRQGSYDDVVDLDGARFGRVRPELVERVAARVAPTPVQASGGIRSLGDARALLEAGADRVVVGTAAWPDPAPWLELGDAVVLAMDLRDGELRTKGWTEGAGLSLAEAASRAPGARALVTAIDRDGTLMGPDLELVARAAAIGLRVLAAGGVRTPDDVDALAEAGAEAAVVGRALLAPPPPTPVSGSPSPRGDRRRGDAVMEP